MNIPRVRAAAALHIAIFDTARGRSATPGIFKGVSKRPSTKPRHEVPVKSVTPMITAVGARKKIPSLGTAALVVQPSGCPRGPENQHLLATRNVAAMEQAQIAMQFRDHS